MNRKIVSLLAALLLCLSLFPAQALAAEGTATIGASYLADTGALPQALPKPGAGLCEHHLAHTAGCGYTAAAEGKACTFACKICAVQALVAALPGEVTEENQETVRAQLDDILARFGELAEEEQAQVDLTRCLTLQTALDAANDPAPIPEGLLTTPLDFTNVGDGEGQTPAQGPGYRWSGDRESGYLLELTNFQMDLTDAEIPPDPDHIAKWAIRIPVDGPIIIQVTGENQVIAPETAVLRAQDYSGNSPVVLQGSGTLTTDTNSLGFFSQDFQISGVTIRSTTVNSGVRTDHGNIILRDTTFSMNSKGVSAPCIWTSKGSMTISGSTVDLSSDGDRGLFVRGGDLKIGDSHVEIDAGYDSGISCGQAIIVSGNSSVSSACTSTYGIYAQGGLEIQAPAQVTTEGSSAAIVTFKDIALKGVAVIAPTDGIITPPSGSSNVYTVRVEGAAAKQVEIKQVQLLIEPEQPACNYGETTAVTITSQPELAVPVTIYRGEEVVGSGNLGSPIPIDSSKWAPGSHTLTAKLRENTGIVTKEFALFVRATPTVSALPAASLPYGAALSGAVLTGGRVVDPVSQKTVAGTWSWKDGTILPTTENNGYTAVFTPADTATYNAVEQTVKPLVTPKPLAVAGAAATDRAYDGTNRVAITDVTLGGTVGSDDVSVDTAGLHGTVSGSDVGRYSAVTLPATLSLTGSAAKNYTLTQPAAPVSTDVTIVKAPPLTPTPGDLAVANGQAHTYTYGLGALRPEVPAGMSLGSTAVTYTLGSINLGGYYTGGAVIDGQTLTLPIQPVDSEEVKEIGTVTVFIHTGNYEDMAATLHLRSVNKILPEGAPALSAASITYGQPIGEISLSGVMRDPANGKEVPGTFAWSNPDNRPAAQEAYAAAWVFTPADNHTYAMVTGTALVRVLPASITQAVVELEPAAFRYDGAAHAPGIASVQLGNTLLTAGVDYTAEIPQGSAAGSYTVTVTGQGNYTGVATATFTVNPVTAEEVTLPNGSRVQLSVEGGLSSVPEGLRNTPFSTIPAIERELQARVTAALSGAGDQICVYDVRLQYLENGVWKDVDPADFPAGGVTVVLPYPDGTGAVGYTFTVQHMVAHGPNAGTVETLAYTAVAAGLQCRFTSLSPVAVGYKTTAKQPYGGEDSSSDDREDGYDFWQEVRQKIEAAKPGDTVRVNAGSYDQLPRAVMEALKRSDRITLILRHNGGADIVIPSEKALDEALRVYYPLAYLAGYDFGIPTGSGRQNPATGGIWEVNAPTAAQAPLPSAGTPQTPVPAGQGVEKAVAGVYEPAVNPASVQGGAGGIFALMVLFLLAALPGLLPTGREKRKGPHRE